MWPRRYPIQRAIHWPLTRVRRRRNRDAPALAVAMLDAFYWRRSMLDFMAATADNPGILHDAELGPDSVVVDVGAHVGEWAVPVATRYRCRVLAFEPSPTSLVALRQAVAQVNRVEIFEYALGSADGREVLAEEGPGSTLSRAVGAFGSTEVDVRDVADTFDRLGLGPGIDLLKLNVEGAEYDLLDRLWDTAWLARVAQLSVQFHEWHPDAYARRRQIRRRLARTHEQIWSYDWVWEFWRRRG